MYVSWREATNKLFSGVWDIIYYRNGRDYFWVIKNGVLYRSSYGSLRVATEDRTSYSSAGRVEFTNIKGEEC